MEQTVAIDDVAITVSIDGVPRNMDVIGIFFIDEGDKNGTVTYRIELGPKGKNYVHFVDEDNFITREQIRNHAEILPPYVLGCDCKLLPKQPWENPSKSGWKAVVPSHGSTYDVPDWRQLA